METIVIGAGPAGVTAGLELVRRSKIRPIVIEQSDGIGGISRTFSYKGNRIDIGGHRFFSKSTRVMHWWQEILPLQGSPVGFARVEGESDLEITYHQGTRLIPIAMDGPDPDEVDRVMLVRNRISRIYYAGKFFSYPIGLDLPTLWRLGPIKTARITSSYLRSLAFPIHPEQSLEDFFINRFGRELYGTFFRDYTEKVWGRSCSEIEADWGRQRVRGLSIKRAVAHALWSIVPFSNFVRQRHIETSLIERFLYPKFGPGQLWECAAEEMQSKGGRLQLNERVIELHHKSGRIEKVTTQTKSGERNEYQADFVLSSMPIKDLVAALRPNAPEAVTRVTEGLEYRDFVTVGLLYRKLRPLDRQSGQHPLCLPADTWIYVQEPGYRVGRIQFFNNWSPYLLADPDTVWVGLEYFCNQQDELWNKPDTEMLELARSEFERLGFGHPDEFLDGVVLRVPKTYPAYWGTYQEFPVVQRYLEQFENLYAMGRNGMHRYNNQDHSMLTAMASVDHLLAGKGTKASIWGINAESEYHEEVLERREG